MMHRRAATLMCMAFLAACSRERVDAPPPALSDDPASANALPASSLNVPISYDLTPIALRLEDVVPGRFGDLEKRDTLSSNTRISFAVEAQRDSFHVELDGRTAKISTIIRYRGRGWYDPPVGPSVSGSCGTGDDDPPRRVDVSMSADLDLTSNWTLVANSRVERVAPATERDRDRCRVTIARIDITDRLVRAARSLLDSNTDRIDAAIAEIDVRSNFEEWWTLLQTPIELTDSVWLLINPLQVRKGETGGRGLLLNANVGLTAAPRIVVGPRPAVVPAPLPPLDTGTVEPGLHVLVEGVVDYEVASGVLTEQLRGRTFEGAGRRIRIREVELSGIGGGRLGMRIVYDGYARGSLWFVGTPHFDPATNQVSVPDLDVDVASEDLLVRGLAWLTRESTVAFLRERARFPVEDPVLLGRRYLLEGLNRNLSDDVRLSGEVISVLPVGVVATRRVLLVRAHAQANARLTIRENIEEKQTPVIAPTGN